MKIGRNQPCPCGSGKKHKHCCLSTAGTTRDDLKEFLSSQEFDSLAELQAATNTFMAKQNLQPRDDFFGLSSEQVYRMLHFAFDSPELFQFADLLSVDPDAPIMVLIESIVSAIDDTGLKATKATGSLPQKLCREAWSDYKKSYPNDTFAAFRKVNKEDDFTELNVARMVLELAGFLRKTKGRFYLTKKYQKAISKSGLTGLYPIIFKTYCDKFNWAYWDRYDEAPFLQQSFLFTLYLLKLHGEKMVFTSVYTEDFLRAFPIVVDEMGETTYSTPEDQLCHCYQSRVFERFLVFFGLAELETIKSDKLYEIKHKIKKTSLFDAFVQFNLRDSKVDNIVYLNKRSDE